jgi:hypothetical protein
MFFRVSSPISGSHWCRAWLQLLISLGSCGLLECRLHTQAFVLHDGSESFTNRLETSNRTLLLCEALGPQRSW